MPPAASWWSKSTVPIGRGPKSRRKYKIRKKQTQSKFIAKLDQEINSQKCCIRG